MSKECFYVGIDPGVNGAIAVLDCIGDLYYYDFLPTKIGRRSRRIVDPIKFMEVIIEDIDYSAKACIEDVWGGPKMGVASAFSFGHAVATIEVLLAVNSISRDYVTPREWKKKFNLLKCAKKASIDRALDLYPNADLPFTKDHNIADAILIARYCFEKY